MTAAGPCSRPVHAPNRPCRWGTPCNPMLEGQIEVGGMPCSSDYRYTVLVIHLISATPSLCTHVDVHFLIHSPYSPCTSLYMPMGDPQPYPASGADID